MALITTLRKDLRPATLPSEASTAVAVPVADQQLTDQQLTDQQLTDQQRRLRVIFWFIAIVLGIINTWKYRHVMSADGISYLDMSDAIMRGDWGMVINGYWSPLYPLLLGVAMAVLKPSPEWEFPVAHLVNFIIYLLALGCFDFFLREVIRYQRDQAARLATNGFAALPKWAWVVLGYTLFIWSSTSLMPAFLVTPDMCVAAFIYLASGLLLRIRRGYTGWSTFAILGIVLGFSAMAKAIMFPLSFLYLGISMVLVGNLRQAVPRALLSLIVLLAISGPFIFALSTSKGRLTFGDVGKLAYGWYVADLPVKHWQGQPAGSGTPKHPTRQLLNAPAIYEFKGPIGGTYPVWYDASYWYEGISVPFALNRQIEALMQSARYYSSLLLNSLYSSLIISLFILSYMSRRGWLIMRDMAEHWFLLIPALAVPGLYALVLVESRYIAPFIVLLWVGVFSSVRLTDSPESRRLMTCAPITILAMFIISLGLSPLRGAYSMTRELVSGQGATSNVHWQIADGLRRFRIQRGDEVASIGASNSQVAYWARLAKVRIIAEIYPFDKNNFWKENPSVRKQIIQTFRRAGAKIIVADEVPRGVSTAGWHRIANTNFYVYTLSKGKP